MADQTDVRRIVLSLPETFQDAEDRFAFSVMNRGKRKGIACVWQERVHPKKACEPNPGVIAVQVRDNFEKEMLIDAQPTKFFTEPHYNGYPAVLVRLAAIELDELQYVITHAWRCQAPPALVQQFDDRKAGKIED